MLIATPISTLFRQRKEIEIVKKYSDCFECRDMSFRYKIPKQYLYHSEMSLVTNWTAKERHFLQRIKKNKQELKLISFHLLSCFSEPIVSGRMFHPGGTKYSGKEMFHIAEENIATVRTLFGKIVDIAVENNNYYPTEAYDIVTDGDFLSKIVRQNNIQFLFDISHAKITSHNRNINFDTYIQELPLEHCIQIHISGHTIENGIAYDSHEMPSESGYQFLQVFLEENKNIRYITIEWYKSISGLITAISKTRDIITP